MIASGTSVFVLTAGSGASLSARRRASRQDKDAGVGVQEAVARHQLTSVLVPLSNDHGSVRRVIQSVLDQRLKGRVLLLHDKDLGETAREPVNQGVIEWDRHAQLEKPDAGGPDRVVIAEPQAVEGLLHLVVGISGGGDTDPRIGRVDLNPVQSVVDPIPIRQVGSDGAELLFGGDHPGRPQELCAGMGTRLVFGHDRIVFEHWKIDGAAPVSHWCDDLHRRPQTRGARDGGGMHTQFETLASVARIKNRHVQVDERRVRRRRHR